MKRNRIIPPIFWIGFSLFIMFFAYRLGLEDKSGLEGVRNPGPGLMPFLCALPLLLISIYLLITYLKKSTLKNGAPKPVRQEEGKTGYGKIAFVMASLLGYAFLLDTLGYLVTTFLALALLFGLMGTKWRNAVIASIATVLVTYFVFTRLGLLFPEGIFSLPGMLK